MNGKYYGKREIRWHSREKERLERIRRKDKDESICRNRPDLGHCPGIGSSNVPAKLLAGASYQDSDRR